MAEAVRPKAKHKKLQTKQKRQVREPVILSGETSDERSHVHKSNELLDDRVLCQATSLVISEMSDDQSKTSENVLINEALEPNDSTVEAVTDPTVIEEINSGAKNVESCLSCDTVEDISEAISHSEGERVSDTINSCEGAANNDAKSTSELLEQFAVCITDAMTLTSNVTNEAPEQKNQHCDNAVQENIAGHRNTVMVYGELQQTLKEFVLQENAVANYFEATAPLIESVSDDASAAVPGEQCEESTNVVHTAVQHRKISQMHFEDVIRPFTEAQIKSLYYNAELEANEQFIQQFVETTRQLGSEPFYELVKGYLQARISLVSTTKAIEEIKQAYTFQVNHVWKDVEKIAKAQGKCLDGNVVVGTFNYIKSTYDQGVAVEIQNSLKALQEKIHEIYSLHSYTTEMSKLQVESYLHDLIASSSVISNIPRNAAVQVCDVSTRSSQLHGLVDKIKYCISVLFSFQRQPLKDKQFLMDTRNWLTKLVAILLRVASLEDHLFILNHVLRSPAGVSLWAASYVQIPVLEFQRPYNVGGPFLDHVITVLSTLLLPIRSRDDFLRPLQLNLATSSNSENEDSIWVMVDSEGEEDEDPSNCWLHWCENDLVALLNQIPFGALFRHLLGVVTVNDMDYYDIRNINDQEILRQFSVATHLIYLLREGFKTFNLGRYRQLAKRISQLIRRIVMYITYHLQQFIALHECQLPRIVQRRLQAEYDQLFLRAAYSIFSSQRLGAWQFMAAMPYAAVSEDMLWKILWLLHNDYEENLELIEQEFATSDWRQNIWDHHMSLKFHERLTEMPESEAYYLLTAFANMAISRRRESQNLINTICKEVFEISFINNHTKGMCVKWGKELLSNVATKHPFILSLLVKEVMANMSLIGKVSIFLFQGLPIHLWQPIVDDIKIIADWLKEAPSSPENKLSQLIVSNLDWGVNEKDGKLFLDISLHRSMALLILEANRKHIPSVKNFISESFKQAAVALGSSLSPVEIFNSWCWEMICVLKLHLHQMQRSVAQSSHFQPVPDLMQDLELQTLKWDVKEKNPLALFISFMMTDIGHSIADVCKNIGYIQVLLDFHCYEAVLHILCLVTPLFFNCNHYLWGNKTFMAVIQNLQTADLTYIKMAKNLVVTTFPGIILQNLSGMIEYQQQLCCSMNWSKMDAFNLWFEVLTAFPQWYKIDSILYLLDNILKSTLFNDERIILSAFMNKYKRQLQDATKSEHCHQGASNSFSSFINWMITGSGIPYTLLSKNCGTKFVWFTYVMLEVETSNDQQSKMWKCVLKELASNPMATPTSALKKAFGAESLMPPPVTYLPIYRWAQYAAEIPDNHPLAPLFWQKFFTLYLQRIPYQHDGIGSRSVGLKFFDDMNDLSLLKKLKKKLELLVHSSRAIMEKTAAAFQEVNSGDYSDQKSETDWEVQKSKEHIHQNLTKLYQTFLLWLEESHLHDSSLYLPGLLADYDPPRLQLIFESSQDPWLEFIDFEEVRSENSKLMSKYCNRSQNKFRTSYRHLPSDANTIETNVQLLTNMRSYEDPLPPPVITAFKPVIQAISPRVFESGSSIVDVLMPHINEIKDYAKICCQRFAHHVALDLGYIDLVPQLYKNVETEVLLHVACHKGFSSSFNLGSESKCLGPAAIKLKFHEKKSISSAHAMVDQNRSEWVTLFNEALLGTPQCVCVAAIFIEVVVSDLLKAYTAVVINEPNSYRATGLRDVGLHLFYFLSGLLNSDIELYPPSRQFFSSCVDILGKELIMNHGDQCGRLLQLILSSPGQVSSLAPHFTPNSADIPKFIELYSGLSEIHKRHGASLTFIVLSKFDIDKWLIEAKPKLSDRSKMVNAINTALVDFGVNPSKEFELIHGIYRQHLCKFLLHQFPDMYRDVTLLLFKGMESQSISVQIWYDILNEIVCMQTSSAKCAFSSTSTTEEMSAVCEQFALSQDLFTCYQLQETLENLGHRFMEQRMSSNEILYSSLYFKHKQYVKPFTIFLGLIGHSYVASMKKELTETGPQSGTPKLWETLKLAFSPWILPLEHKGKLWSPWISDQNLEAAETLAIFTSCISFATKTLKDSYNILSYLLDMYVKHFAIASVSEHILCVIHQAFTTLTWSPFWPDLTTVKIMMSILNRGIPDCTDFLRSVFARIAWPAVVNHSLQEGVINTVVQQISCLLHLHIGLGLGEKALKDNLMSGLLDAAHAYPWHLVDAKTYDGVIKRFLELCNPLCVFSEESVNDAEVFSLLQAAAEFVPGAQIMHPEVKEKRVIFVRAKIKLLCDCAAKNKPLLNSRMELFKQVIFDLMNQVEAVLFTASKQDTFFEEASCVITEIFNVLNIALLTLLQDITLKAMQDWVKSHPRSLILGPCLYAASRSIASIKYMSVLCETIIESYFSLVPEATVQLCGWGFVHTFLQVPQLTQQALIAECLKSSHFLVLNGVATRLQSTCPNAEEEWKILLLVVTWLQECKPLEENEYKIPLLWWRLFEGIVRLRGSQTSESISQILVSIASPLHILGEDKASQGLFGAIGFGKKSQLSVRFRLLARVLLAFILLQASKFESRSSLTPLDSEISHSSVLCKQFQAAVKLLEQTKYNKQYNDLKEHIQFGVNFINDATKELQDYNILLSHYLRSLFGDKHCLKLVVDQNVTAVR